MLKKVDKKTIILIVVVLIRTYIVTPITVVGNSMVPTLHNKELLLLSKISYKIHDIDRWDIVVIKENDWIIKRVIGLPGEKIEYKDEVLYINDKEVEDKYSNGETKDFDMYDIYLAGLSEKKEDKTDKEFETIPKGYYLVLGDNREISKDSRTVGLIKEDEIQGKAIFRFWPLNKIKILK